MIWLTVALFLLALFAMLFAYFLLGELRHTRITYENTADMLLEERDRARAESETLRKALFPQLQRMSQTETPRDQKPTVTGAPSGVPFASRKPFRLLFKDKVREHNTKQKGTDKMVSAIAHAQEEKHA